MSSYFLLLLPYATSTYVLRTVVAALIPLYVLCSRRCPLPPWSSTYLLHSYVYRHEQRMIHLILEYRTAYRTGTYNMHDIISHPVALRTVVLAETPRRRKQRTHVVPVLRTTQVLRTRPLSLAI